MFLEQPYNSDTTVNVNKSELTFLVNRYIIDTYSALAKNKKVPVNEIVVGSKKINCVSLYGISTSEKDIIDLAFPFYNEKDGWIVFDLRKYYNYSKTQDKLEPRTTQDHTFMDTRNFLTGIWCAGGSNSIQKMKLPHLAYAKWLSNLIANRFGLDIVVKTKILAAAFILYYRMFTENETPNSDEKELLSIRSRDLYIDTDLFDTVYDQTRSMNTLETFCNFLPIVTNSVRLEGFGIGLLLKLTQTGWIGTDNKINVGVGLEFPPIWVAMCYTSIINNFYSRTSIGDSAQSLGKRGKGDEFVKEVEQLILTHVKVS